MTVDPDISKLVEELRTTLQLVRPWVVTCSESATARGDLKMIDSILKRTRNLIYLLDNGTPDLIAALKEAHVAMWGIVPNGQDAENMARLRSARDQVRAAIHLSAKHQRGDGRARAFAADALEHLSASKGERVCTCDPADNPPVPCARRYALAQCREAANPTGQSTGEPEANKPLPEAERVEEIARIIDQLVKDGRSNRMIAPDLVVRTIAALFAPLEVENARLQSAIDIANNASGQILSGSPGPLFDAGFTSGVGHIKDLIRQALSGPSS